MTEQARPRRWVFPYHLVMALFAVLVIGPLTYMLSDRTPPFLLTTGTIVPDPVRKAAPAIEEARAHIPRGARSSGGYAKLGVDLIDADGKPRPNPEITQETIAAISKLPWPARGAAASTVGGVAVVTWQARFLRNNKPEISFLGITLSTRFCPGSTQRELVDAQQSLWPKLVRSRAGVWHPSGDPIKGAVTTPVLEVPEQMSSGTATYHVTNFYYCNTLQQLLHWPIVAGTAVGSAASADSQSIKFGISSR